MTSLRIISMFLILLVLGACEVTFDPKGSFEDAVVVYGLLRSTSDSQFVRVHSTYDPPGFDPLAHVTEPDLALASVRIVSDSGIVTLIDSVVTHPDPRYGGSLRMFYTAPFVPARGLPYTLQVQVPGYPMVSARTTVPRVPVEFRLSNTAILNSPRFYENQDILLLFKAPPETWGFLPRFYIEYDLTGATPRTERREIPYRLIQTESEERPDFPDLQAIEPSSFAPYNVQTFWSVQTQAYRAALDDIVGRYGESVVRFRRVIVHLYQVDESTYKYYNIANGFRDEFSIRTDLPDYSNVTGGVGVFGAVALDSILIPVNATILF